MKKLISFLTAAIILALLPGQIASALTFTPSVDDKIEAQAYYLYNLDADECVSKKNETTKIEPGYLTMLMTAIITIESIPDLGTTIECKNYSATYGLPSADFREGEVTTVRDSLYAMLLYNSCQEAMNLANTLASGNIDSEFVPRMNRRARELGAVNTNFVDPFGASDENQYTTAEDIATIYRHALTLSQFKTIASTYEYALSVEESKASTHGSKWNIWHKNGMMKPTSRNYFYQPLATSVVSCTEYGGCSLAMSASEGGNNYVVVVLNAPTTPDEDGWYYLHYVSAKTLADWAFDYISYEIILSSDDEVSEISVDFAQGDGYVIAEISENYIGLWCSEFPKSKITKNITLYNDYIIAPVDKGAPLGKITLTCGDEELYSGELIAANSVSRSNLGYSMKVISLFLKSDEFDFAAKASLIFFVSTLLLFAIIRLLQYILQRQYDKVWEAEKRKHSRGRSIALRESSTNRPSPAKNRNNSRTESNAKSRRSSIGKYDTNAAFDTDNDESKR